jgi:hypothetical protein
LPRPGHPKGCPYKRRPPRRSTLTTLRALAQPLQTGGTVLYVDLEGNGRVLWQRKGTFGYFWSIPSPDGRYLAILNTVFNSNVWMLEGF